METWTVQTKRNHTILNHTKYTLAQEHVRITEVSQLWLALSSTGSLTHVHLGLARKKPSQGLWHATHPAAQGSYTCCCLEIPELTIINHSQQGALHFHFILGPPNYVAGLEVPDSEKEFNLSTNCPALGQNWQLPLYETEEFSFLGRRDLSPNYINPRKQKQHGNCNSIRKMEYLSELSLISFSFSPVT